MSIAATIQVQRVETKPTQRGSVFKVFDSQGTEYATFDAGLGNLAVQYSGKPAAITFTEKQHEKNGRVYTDRYLDSIEPAPEGAPIDSRKPDGSADWDIIGLRKTRCALWGAYLGSPLAARVAAKSLETGFADVNAIYNAGRTLVEMAEFDIFQRDEPAAGEDPSIPF